MKQRAPLPFAGCFPLLILLAAAAPGGARAQTLELTPAELFFTLQVGGAGPPPQTVSVATDPAGLEFTARVDPSIIGAGFLTIEPSSGVTPATLTVSVDASGFQTRGERQVDLRVRLPEQEISRIIPVTVRAVEGPLPTSISVEPPSFSFTGDPQGAPPAPQTLNVRNGGDGTLNYDLLVVFPSGEPSGWLAVEPVSGSSSGQAVAHTVSVDVTGLPVGRFSASILIEGDGENSPVTVPVSLILGTARLLSAAPERLEFNASEEGPAPAPQTLSIAASGGEELSYEIASNQSWLTVTPESGTAAAGPVTHSVAVDPSGLGAGTFNGLLMITSAEAENSPLEVEVTLTVTAPGDLTVLPPRLNFVANRGELLQLRQLARVFTTPFSVTRWRASTDPPEADWLEVSPSSGAAPAHLMVEVDPSGLEAGTFDASVVIRPEGAAAALGGRSRRQAGAAVLPVRLTVVDGGLRGEVRPQRLLFQTTQGAASPAVQLLDIAAEGGETLSWTAEASTETGGPWLSVSPAAGEGPGRAVVAADPAGLGTGVHQGWVDVTTEVQNRFANTTGVTRAPVTFVVSEPAGVLEVSRTGVYFEAAEDAAAVAPQQVRVINRGPGSIDWNARVREEGGGPWLAVTPRTGSATGPAPQGQPETLSLVAGPEGLAPGLYTGVVEVSALTANSPRLITAMLRVLPPGAAPEPTLDPSGLVFVAPGGDPPAGSRTVQVWNNAGAPSEFQAAASVVGEGSWLSVAPQTGASSDIGTAELTVGLDASGLEEGVYEGQVGVTFGGGRVRSARVVLVVPPRGTEPCAAGGLAVVPLSPPLGFRAATGKPVEVAAEVVDGCGRRLSGLPVLSVSGGANPALPLKPSGGGRYHATWTPRNAGEQTEIRLAASQQLLQAEGSVLGSVEGSSGPLLAGDGVVGGATFAAAKPLAPGTIFSAFGSFGAASTAASRVPLPTELSGVSVLLGGSPAPLYFASAGQLNAQAPVTLRPATITQALVKAGQLHTVPREVAIAAARPAIFRTIAAGGVSRAVAQNRDFSRNTPNRPARPGEAVIVYLTGVGEVSPAVNTGRAAPSMEPLARVTGEASATISGVAAPILFLGLSPGFVGLAQANLLITEEMPAGPEVPVVITVGGEASNAAVIAIRESAASGE